MKSENHTMPAPAEVLYVYRCTACGHRASFISPTTYMMARPRSAHLVARPSGSSGTVASHFRLEFGYRSRMRLRPTIARVPPPSTLLLPVPRSRQSAATP
jgi:hypothetical protein